MEKYFKYIDEQQKLDEEFDALLEDDSRLSQLVFAASQSLELPHCSSAYYGFVNKRIVKLLYKLYDKADINCVKVNK